MRALTPDEHRRIDEAAAAAQARTHAHFSLAIVAASDRYRLFPPLGAALLTLIGAGIAALIDPDLPLWFAFSGEVVLFAVATIVFNWKPIRIALVPRGIKEGEARRLAHLEFAARILARADHADGILFFVSRAERHVELIASRAVHAEVGAAEWNRIVAEFVRDVKAGRLVEGFTAAIGSCAAHLERHFPNQG
jgi:putative membrane protein